MIFYCMKFNAIDEVLMCIKSNLNFRVLSDNQINYLLNLVKALAH